MVSVKNSYEVELMISDRISSLTSKFGESLRSRLGDGRRGNSSENICQDGAVELDQKHRPTHQSSPEREAKRVSYETKHNNIEYEEGEKEHQEGASSPPSSRQKAIDAGGEDSDSTENNRADVGQRSGPHEAPEFVTKASSSEAVLEEGEVEKPEPSRETGYVYIQTSRNQLFRNYLLIHSPKVTHSGGFRRITLEEFLRSRQIENEVENARAARSKSLTLRSFDDVRTAHSIQNTFHKFVLVISGLLAGIAVGQAFVAFMLDSLAWTEEYRWMAIPTQSIFLAGLTICLLETFDRLEVEGSAEDAIRLVLRRGGGLSVLVALLAAICALLMTPYDEMLAAVETEQLGPNAYRMWRLLSAARAILSVLSWVLLAAHASLPYNFMNAYLDNYE